jgi:hypothetical protein
MNFTLGAIVLFVGTLRLSYELLSSILSEESRSTVSLTVYESVSKSFRTGRMEREMQMVDMSVIKCSCIAIW